MVPCSGVLTSVCCLVQGPSVEDEESAHLNVPYVAYLPEKVEPELMYGLFTDVCDSLDKVIEVLK